MQTPDEVREKRATEKRGSDRRRSARERLGQRGVKGRGSVRYHGDEEGERPVYDRYDRHLFLPAPTLLVLLATEIKHFYYRRRRRYISPVRHGRRSRSKSKSPERAPTPPHWKREQQKIVKYTELKVVFPSCYATRQH